MSRNSTPMTPTNERNQATLADHVLAVFAFLQNHTSERDILVQKVYDGFRILSEDPDFSDLFGDLYFSTYGGPSYSKRLENILFSMSSAGILGVNNSNCRQYTINKTAWSSLHLEIEKELPAYLIARLKSATERFYGSITAIQATSRTDDSNITQNARSLHSISNIEVHK